MIGGDPSLYSGRQLRRGGSEKEQIKRKLQKSKSDYMYRLLVLFWVVTTFISCSKNEDGSLPPDVIPDIIDGVVTEFNVTPIDINTPDKGTFFIDAISARYRVDFDAAAQAASNAILLFENDTILTDDSREFGNFGNDAVAYYPVKGNQISITFNDGRSIDGLFDINTSFGGVFGAALISQWRTSGDPAKPNQKAKDDIINLVQRYSDRDGPGPETAPQYLFVKVSKS